MVTNWNPAAPPYAGEAAWGVAPGQSLHDAWWNGAGTGAAGLNWQQKIDARRDDRAVGYYHGDDQSYRWFEPDTREFYEANPTQAYQGFLDFGFGDRNRPLLDYAKSQYSRAYAAALRGQEASTAVPGQVTPPGQGPHWTDYLTPDLVYQIRQGFNMQSASNRGVTNQFMPQGRFAGG